MGSYDAGLPNQVGRNKFNFLQGDLKYLGPGSKITFTDSSGMWLRLGNIFPWDSRFNGLLKNHKGYCIRDFPTANSVNTTYSTGANAYYINSNYVVIGGSISGSAGSDHKYSSDFSFGSSQVSSLNTLIYGTNCSCVLGNTLMVGGVQTSGSLPGYAVSLNNATFNGASSGISNPVNFTNMASNNSNLAVISQQSNSSNGTLYVTTNGTNFTAQTGTGGTNALINATYWSPCANAFLYTLNVPTAAINKTANGYTQTAVTLPSGLASSPFYIDSWKTKCASSTTSTIILMTDGRLLRTADGINFTVIDPYVGGDCSLIPIPSIAKITFDGVRYIIQINTNLVAAPMFIYSEDDGNTWFYSHAFESITDGILYPLNAIGLQFTNGKLLALMTQPSGNTVQRLYDLTGLVGSGAVPTKVGTLKQLISYSTSNSLSSYAYLKVTS